MIFITVYMACSMLLPACKFWMLNSSFDYILLLEEQSALLGNTSSFPSLQDTHKLFQSFQDRDFKAPFQLKNIFTSLDRSLVTIWFL